MFIPRNDWLRWLACVVWLGGIVAGFVAWERYDSHPGGVGCCDDDDDEYASGRWSLVMFAHPHCPCMRATLTELRELMVHSPVELDVRVVLVRPSDAADGWERGKVAELAASIPGVRVECDRNGAEATHAGASASGYVVVRDPEGHIAFRGGITKARGRTGDNTGLRAVLSILRGESKLDREAPVFGCPLFSPGSRCDEGKSACQR